MKGQNQCCRAFLRLPTRSEPAAVVDEVMIGCYTPEGAAAGEMLVSWRAAAGEVVPCLTVFGDAWQTLASCRDLIDALVEAQERTLEPAAFCSLLRRCGFAEAGVRQG